MTTITKLPADDFAARTAELAKLNRQVGHIFAMLEIQEWAKQNRDALKHAGLLSSLLRAVGQ